MVEEEAEEGEEDDELLAFSSKDDDEEDESAVEVEEEAADAPSDSDGGDAKFTLRLFLTTFSQQLLQCQWRQCNE